VSEESVVKLAREQFKPFFFRLIQDIFPGEDVWDEDQVPIRTYVIWLLMGLAGVAALLYAFALGILSRP